MLPIQNTKSFRNFAKHLFLISRVHSERNKAKEDVDDYLKKMRKSIIRMNLSYTNIDRLKQKVDNLVNLERKYAKFFRPEDRETLELKEQIKSLEQELRNEREEKLSIISENDEKIMELTESLDNIKNKMKHLFMEKAKKQHRLNALEQRINKNIDTQNYYKL